VRDVVKPKLNWDTVELVDVELNIAPGTPRRSPRQPSRGPLALAVVRGDCSALVRRILAGGSMKARACGAVYTHVQICVRLEPGLEAFAYGWGLVAAALMIEFSSSERYSRTKISRSVEIAAFVIHAMSERLAARIARA
jgi:hypothetical protein